MNISATTEQGRKVILKDNGTWEYSQEIVVQGNNVFRKSHWGMTKAQVRDLEGVATIHESDDVLAYPGGIGGLQCNIIYIFVFDKLVRAKYVITERHASDNKYFLDFDILNEALVKKYGKPATDDMFWSDNSYRAERENWGLALSMGHCARYISWNSQNTNILLYMSGDNFEVELGIEYTSQAMQGLEEEKKTNQLLEDL